MQELSQKYINRLSNSQWFHATDEEGLQSILKTGVQAAHNKGSELDFGYGFYLSPSLEEAKHYVDRLYNAVSSGLDEIHIVIGFEFIPIQYAENFNFRLHVFSKCNIDFAQFIFKNRWYARTKPSITQYQQQHDYDMIYGPMSDGNPIHLLEKYEHHCLSYEEVLAGLKENTSAKQLSIHNQQLCDTLQIMHIYQYHPKTKQMKEVTL